MRVYALANQKGGCGKTTTAINLAGALAARGRRVLLVDLDPQGHATLGLGQAVLEEGADIASVLLDGAALASVLRPAPGGFQLAPAGPRLVEFEGVAERELQPERRLGRALAPLEGSFDCVLLDCPPRADGVLTASAVRASDRIVLVVETGAFALQGALRARTLLEELARDLERALPLWVVATLYDRRTRFAREVLIGMHARFGPALFDTAIRESVRLREAAAFGVPVQVLDPRSRAAADFAALAAELSARELALAPATARGAPVHGSPERGSPEQGAPESGRPLARAAGRSSLADGTEVS